MDKLIYDNPLFSSEKFYKCKKHGIPYPSGAKCPACEALARTTRYRQGEGVQRKQV